ncbi:MAG: LysR family transcriptional regulator [Polyangiales bacterium]
MLERTHLNLMRELAREGSLTSAARKLGSSQSALSHAVRKLEEQLGTKLWEREGRSLRLTPAGAHLSAFAQRIAPQFEHAEHVIAQIARGERGTLRIGMECHPCYRWILRVIEPYVRTHRDVDLDVKQKFQFGGIGALFAHEIDMLVTPDPLRRKGLRFEPVFDYEQVLVVSADHALARRAYVVPADLEPQTLITYPVEVERLDIFSQFLLPAGCTPKRHVTIETTDIMLQLVASGRGVAALPRWLVKEYTSTIPVRVVRLGRHGVAKQIFLGTRVDDAAVDYIAAFIKLARTTQGSRKARATRG